MTTADFRAAVLGCRGRGLDHAQQLQRIDGVELVALADMVSERRAQARAELGPEPKLYDDFDRMLSEERPDLVVITTATNFRYTPIAACVNAGVTAIQCEKPMAPSWSEARAIHELCQQNDVRLTFCHQRRFAAHYRQARQLLADGGIGDLVYLQGFTPDFFDWGTHWIDMFGFFNNESPATSVMAQFDRSIKYEAFSQPGEHSSICGITYANGVRASLVTDQSLTHPHIMIRAIGTQGMMEVGPRDEPRLRLLTVTEKNWQTPAPPTNSNNTINETGHALEALIRWHRTGEEPEHSSAKALAATEILFAGMRSCREGAAIAIPMGEADIELATFINSG